MTKVLISIAAMFLVCSDGYSQETKADSSKEIGVADHCAPLRQWTAPAVLVGSGVIVLLDSDADEFFISNFETREERNENFINFSNHLDDYLQHVPSASVFVLSLSNIRRKA